MSYIEEFDKLKTKVLKYILFKKRTENEVRQKFISDEGELLNDVIDELKELDYINDSIYIKKAVKEYMNLKNLSIKEIEYKLISKGINKGLIDEYVSNNKEILFFSWYDLICTLFYYHKGIIFEHYLNKFQGLLNNLYLELEFLLYMLLMYLLVFLI